MTNKYATLDAAILSAVASGKSQFSEIQTTESVWKATAPLCNLNTHKPHWRFVDSRLQALRKSGELRYDRKAGWILTKGGAA